MHRQHVDVDRPAPGSEGVGKKSTAGAVRAGRAKLTARVCGMGVRRGDREVVVGGVEHGQHPAPTDDAAHQGIPRTFTPRFAPDVPVPQEAARAANRPGGLADPGRPGTPALRTSVARVAFATMEWTLLYLFIGLKIPIADALRIVWWAVRQPRADRAETATAARRVRPHAPPAAPPPRRGPHGDPAPLPPPRVRTLTARARREPRRA